MKASYERPLTRAELIALLGYFYGSPDRDRLEQIAAHDAAQREIIDAQARENALLASEPAKAPFVSRNEEWGLRPDFTTAGVTAPPPSAAVREAAEVVRTILMAHDARLSESGALTYGPPSKGTGFVAAIQWLRRYDAARGGE